MHTFAWLQDVCLEALPAWMQVPATTSYHCCVGAAVEALLAVHRRLSQVTHHYPLFSRRFGDVLAAAATALQAASASPACTVQNRDFCRQICIQIRGSLMHQ